MGLAVYWLQLAEDKLDDIYYYYELKAGKRIARKLINGIVDATVHLKNHPKMGKLNLACQKENKISIFGSQKLYIG